MDRLEQTILVAWVVPVVRVARVRLVLEHPYKREGSLVKMC
jgi:hypothetical protein